MDGQVSGLGTVHPLLTLSFVSTWILPLHVVSSTLKRKSSSSVMDGLQRREEDAIEELCSDIQGSGLSSKRDLSTSFITGFICNFFQ